MCILGTIAGCRRTLGIISATSLFCTAFGIASIRAQSNNDNVPPWQLPPGEGSERRAAFEQTAVEREAESIPQAGPSQSKSAPLSPPHVAPGSEGGRMIDSDWGESRLCGDGEGLDCDCENCLNPVANRLWFRGEFLAMWNKAAASPALATTNTDPNTPRPNAGVIGVPTTRVLFGGENDDVGVLTGGRFTLGYRFKPCEDTGLEVTYMFLGDKSLTFSADSNTTPIIARPFFDVQTSQQNSFVIALPTDQQTGSTNIRLSDDFNSLDTLWRKAIYTPSGRQVDFLAGYRYAHFGELLAIDSQSTLLGATSLVHDQFGTENDFNGAEIGISTKSRYCCWSVELLGKFALGNTRSIVDISGNSSIVGGAASNGGLLALPTNIQRFETNNLTVMPELGVTLTYDVSNRLKATLGYTFLYWSRVARASEQINLDVNPSQLSGGTLTGNPAPQFRYVPGDYWVQGLTLGLDCRF